jgi:YD repeat-containing protein
MKKLFVLALLTGAILTSCSKKSDTTITKPTEPTVLLTKVINNTIGDANIGKSIAEFTYSGKQLTKAVLYHYPDVETNLFSYDNNGHLTGSTITHTVTNTYDYVSSTVSYSGDNISEIKFYQAGNILDADVKLTYQDGKLTNWFNSNEVSLTYAYDSNGHNTKQTAVEYQSGKPDGYQYVTTNTSFDDKSNISNALPNWVYFRAYTEDQSLGYTPGINNPVSSSDDGTAFTYSYQYNGDGYPSAISWTDSYPQSYQYEYTKVQ